MRSRLLRLASRLAPSARSWGQRPSPAPRPGGRSDHRPRVPCQLDSLHRVLGLRRAVRVGLPGQLERATTAPTTWPTAWPATASPAERHGQRRQLGRQRQEARLPGGHRPRDRLDRPVELPQRLRACLGHVGYVEEVTSSLHHDLRLVVERRVLPLADTEGRPELAEQLHPLQGHGLPAAEAGGLRHGPRDRRGLPPGRQDARLRLDLVGVRRRARPTHLLAGASLARLPALPAEGTFLRGAQREEVYRVVGGAPVFVSSWAPSAEPAATPRSTRARSTRPEPAASWNHLRAKPAEGTCSRRPARRAVPGRRRRSGARLVVGEHRRAEAPSWMSTQAAIDRAGTGGRWGHLSHKPRNGSYLRGAATGYIYEMSGGYGVPRHVLGPGRVGPSRPPRWTRWPSTGPGPRDRSSGRTSPDGEPSSQLNPAPADPASHRTGARHAGECARGRPQPSRRDDQRPGPRARERSERLLATWISATASASGSSAAARRRPARGSDPAGRWWRGR